MHICALLLLVNGFFSIASIQASQENIWGSLHLWEKNSCNKIKQTHIHTWYTTEFQRHTHTHPTHNATSNAQLWAEQRCQGITEHSRNTGGYLSMSGHIGLASSQLSKADIRSVVASVYYQESASVCTAEATVATSNSQLQGWKAGVEHVVRSHLRTGWEALAHKHKKEHGVKLSKCCRSLSKSISAGRSGVRLITVLAWCVWSNLSLCKSSGLTDCAERSNITQGGMLHYSATKRCRSLDEWPSWRESEDDQPDDVNTKACMWL